MLPEALLFSQGLSFLHQGQPGKHQQLPVSLAEVGEKTSRINCKREGLVLYVNTRFELSALLHSVPEPSLSLLHLVPDPLLEGEKTQKVIFSLLFLPHQKAIISWTSQPCLSSCLFNCTKSRSSQ